MKIKIIRIVNVNNLAGSLVYYYDVGNIYATLFTYTRALHVPATTCMVQPTTIHNGIENTLEICTCSSGLVSINVLSICKKQGNGVLSEGKV